MSRENPTQAEFELVLGASERVLAVVDDPSASRAALREVLMGELLGMLHSYPAILTQDQIQSLFRRDSGQAEDDTLALAGETTRQVEMYNPVALK